MNKIKETPLKNFVITFTFITIIRAFLEHLIEKDYILNLESFGHFTLWFITIAELMIIILHKFTKENIKTISKILLLGSTIIITPPIIDYFLSGGEGYKVAYLMPANNKELIMKFLTFFGKFNGLGITPGIRIELAVILVTSLIYFTKKETFVKALIKTVIIYAAGFIMVSLPYFLQTDNVETINYFLGVLNFVLTIILYYQYNKKYFKEIIKDIRIHRLTYYSLLIILGTTLAINWTQLSVNDFKDNLLKTTLAIIIITMSWLYSVFTNNLADKEIDKISNKKRPTITKKIDGEHYTKLSNYFLALSIIYSALINEKLMILNLLYIGFYYIYSNPPIRFKRATLVSKLTISLNSLICLMIGFVLTGTQINLNSQITWLFLIIITGYMNFIDLKDIKGDEKNGIKTIPVLIGEKNAKRVISLFFISLWILIYNQLNNIKLLIPLTIISLTQLYYLNKKSYNEKPILISGNLALISLIIYLI